MLMRSLSIRQGYKKCADQPDDFSCEISEDIGNSAHPFEVDTQKCDQITQPGKVHAGKKGFSSNIFVLVPLIFSGSLLLGTFFYKMHHGWELSTAFYFSAQVLAGCMYDTPTETDPVSTSFTLMFFLFGSSAMAGAFGAFVSTLVSDSSRIASDARKNIRSGPFEQVPAVDSHKLSRYEGYALDMSWLAFHASRYLALIKFKIGWDAHQSKYITVVAALVWYSMGITYGVLYEGWALSTACRFSLGAMAASGVPPPPCLKIDGYDDCQLGNVRGIFIGVYVMVGVPLFAFTLGQFAGMIVERAIREREMQIMSRPLGESEFKFALSLKRNPKTATATATATAAPYSGNNEKGVDSRLKAASRSVMSEKALPSSADRSTLFAGRDPLRHQCEGEFCNSLKLPEGTRLHGNRQRAYSDSCIRAPSSDHRPTATEQPRESSFSEFAIDFGEFVVLEMLRLRRVDEHDLEAIRNLFDDIDYDNAGTIDQAKLERFSHLLHTSARADLQEADREVAPQGTRIPERSVLPKIESEMSISCHDCVISPLAAVDSGIGNPQYYSEGPEVVEHPGSSGSRVPVMASNGAIPDRLSIRSDATNSTQYSTPREQHDDFLETVTSSTPLNGKGYLDGSYQRDIGRGADGDKSEETVHNTSTFSRLGGDFDSGVDLSRPRGGSVASKEGSTVPRHSLTDEYNRLLMPILHLRHQASSASATRRSERRPSIGSTATETSPSSIRRPSFDIDAYSDCESEDSPTRRGALSGQWPISGGWGSGAGAGAGEGGAGGIGGGLDSNGRRLRDRCRNGFSGYTSEGGSDHAEAAESGSGSGSGRGPREETDPEEGGPISSLLKTFGFSKYGAMNAIEEENV